MTTTEKVLATIVEHVNLPDFLAIQGGRSRIGMDVRVDRGSLSIGKKVKLYGPNAVDDTEILGIEMLSDPRDPRIVRIHCSKPKMAIPFGKIDGWTLQEEYEHQAS